MKAHTRPTARRTHIDLGLAVLDIVRPRGVPLQRRLIADICGCSEVRIWQIEREAIAKIKQRIRNPGDYLAADTISNNYEHYGDAA